MTISHLGRKPASGAMWHQESTQPFLLLQGLWVLCLLNDARFHTEHWRASPAWSGIGESHIVPWLWLVNHITYFARTPTTSITPCNEVRGPCWAEAPEGQWNRKSVRTISCSLPHGPCQKLEFPSKLLVVSGFFEVSRKIQGWTFPWQVCSVAMFLGCCCNHH